MPKSVTLAEVAEDLGISYRRAWSAVQAGKLPATQMFGRGTAWCVDPGYRDFIGKDASGAGDAESNDEE